MTLRSDRAGLTTMFNPHEIKGITEGSRGSFVINDAGIGGHTTCIVLQFGKRLVIVDTGTGIINQGNKLMRNFLAPGVEMADVEKFMNAFMSGKNPLPELGPRMLSEGLLSDVEEQHISIIQTHTHIDHLHGLPAFKPIFSPKTHVDFYCGTHDGMTLEDIHRNLLFVHPIFPVKYEWLSSKRTYHTFAANDHFEIPSDFPDMPIKVTVRPMNHPNQAHALLFEWGGKRIAITLDHEHGIEELDNNVIATWEEADLVITEVQYDDEMYVYSKGFGHITARAAAKHALASQPKRILITHHDPLSTFERIEQITRSVEKRSNILTQFARDGASFWV